MNTILTIGEARNVLRLDGDDNDDIIMLLLQAIPGYLEVTTGYTTIQAYSPLAKTVAGFLLQLWYIASFRGAICLWQIYSESVR